MSYALLRQLLFLLPPEVAHEVSLHSLKLLCRGPIASALRARAPLSPVEVMGLHFPSRVGLAAGLDKNAEYIDALGALGFGFIEVGTVTPRPQPGNPAPRLFRLPAAEALINRMGFNNQGVEYFLEQVCQARREGFLLGLNIGKNFDTPVENALDDYLTGLRAVYPHADYVTVNISSPNTQGLRSLQHGAALDALLAGLTQEQARLTQAHGRHVPLAIKVAPDLSDEEIIDVADALRRHRIDALIATNTTLSREGVEGLPHAEETGGLSGRPVFARSTRVLEKFGQALAGELPMIAAGGIMSGEDAAAKIKAGASLVQIYTGFIYRGPGLIREIAQRLK